MAQYIFKKAVILQSTTCTVYSMCIMSEMIRHPRLEKHIDTQWVEVAGKAQS